MKKYIVYYHRRGQGKRKFNMMRTSVEAMNASSAIDKTKKKLGKNWVIEKASLYQR